MFLMLAFVCGADQTFTVENRCPPAFTVENKIPAAKAPAPVRPAVTYRQPISHTHTCPYDGEVWDHTKNPSHLCPLCGRQQLVVDQPSRMVQVRNVYPENIPEPQKPIIEYPKNIPFTLPQSSSACGPNGCPSSSAPARVGLFGRFR